MGQNKRWKIGDIEVVRIVEILRECVPDSMLFQDCGPERIRRYPWLLPNYAAPDGRILMNFQAFAVLAGGRRIMVDTCIGNEKHRHAPIFNELQTSFLEDLTAAGFPPESIDTVLCTHLHLDHVGWNTRRVNGRWVPTFPNARYLFSRTEWDFIHGLVDVPGAEVDHLPDSLQPVQEAGLIDFVESPHQVAPGVEIFPTPGHTPGHVSVRLTSGRHTAVITGDLMHHPVQCAEPDLRTNFCADHEQSGHTRRAFLERFGDRRAYVIGSHFCDPTGGWIVRDGEHWRFEGTEKDPT